MRSRWYQAAAAAIEEALDGLPPGASKPQIERAATDAYPFGQRRMHPYKQYLKARADVLRRRYPGHYPVEPAPAEGWPADTLFAKSAKE